MALFKKNSLILLYIIASFFCFTSVVNCAFIDQGASDKALVQVGNGNCNYACWNGFDNMVSGYRVTLVKSDGSRVSYVDSNGNSVLTKSVDFVKSKDNHIYSFGNSARINNSPRINDDYEYKFSYWDEEQKKYVNTNSSSDYVMIFLPDDRFPARTNNLDEFVNTRILSLNQSNDSYNSAFVYKPIWLGWDTAESSDIKVDFVSLFLHYNGYLTDDETFYYDNEQKKIQLKQYFIIMEPIYWVNFKYGGSFIGRYGTSTEIARKMLQPDYINLLWGLWGESEMSALACGTYSFETTLFKESIPKGNCFPKFKNLEFLGGHYQVQENGRPVYSPVYLTNTDYGFGVRTIAMNFDNGDGLDYSANFNIEKCNLSTNGSFRLSFSVAPKDVFLNNLFKKVGDDPTSEVYCFDDVTYDFSNVIDKFTGNNVFTYSLVRFDSSSAHVKRTCYYRTSYNDYYSDIIKDYGNLDISLKLKSSSNKDFNYKFNSNISAKEQIQEKSIPNFGEFKGVRYTFDVEFNLGNGIYLDDKFSSGVASGEIVFSDYDKLFGASNSVVSKMKGNGNNYYLEKDGNTYVYNLLESEGDNCKFTFNVVEGEPVKDFKFREISLDNPFPARDGTSRLPGMNWLNSNNYVYDYISNNRGIIYEHEGDKSVSAEAMYDEMEPMYSITLTPSTMMEIRNYNRRFSYYSMYNTDSYQSKDSVNEDDKSSKGALKMSCNDNGRECFSSFIREKIPEEHLSGVCVISHDVDTLRSKLNEVSNSDIPKSSDIQAKMIAISKGENFYDSYYDLSKNGRIDNNDYIVSFEENHSKNTVFYTCANKTFLSGGPVERSN